MTTPSHIVTARTFIGRPFMHQQRGHSMDCAGLIKLVGEVEGIRFTDLKAYRAEPNVDIFRKLLRQNLGSPMLKGEDIPVGAVVWIAFNHVPHHIALIGDYKFGGLSLIHAFESGSAGKVIETRLDSKWRKKIVEVYRWPA